MIIGADDLLKQGWIAEMKQLLSVVFIFLIASPARAEWSNRGIFAFSTYFMLDFQRQYELVRLPTYEKLYDCSNERYYCADGSAVKLVLPKDCKDFQLKNWTVGAISSYVVDSYDYPGDPHAPPHKEYYIVTKGVDEIAYEYRLESGVTRIFYRSSAQAPGKLPVESMLSLASKGFFSQLRRDYRLLDQQPGLRTGELTTADPMGQCVGPT